MSRKNRKSGNRKALEKCLAAWTADLKMYEDGKLPVFSDTVESLKYLIGHCKEELAKMDAPPNKYHCPTCGRVKELRAQVGAITCSDCGQSQYLVPDVEFSPV